MRRAAALGLLLLAALVADAEAREPKGKAKAELEPPPPPPAVAVEAVRIETPLGPVLLSPDPPPDHYAERFDEGAYWLPGVTEPTPLDRKALRAGRLLRARGKPAVLHVREMGGVRIYTSEGKPFPGVHAIPGAGALWVWIPGVETPSTEQRVQLETVARAEGATVIPPLPPEALPGQAEPPDIPPGGVLGQGKSYPESGGPANEEGPN
jgi:hypothetical protein